MTLALSTALEVLRDLGARTCHVVTADDSAPGRIARAIIEHDEAVRLGLPLELDRGMRLHSRQPWYTVTVRGVMLQARDDAGTWPEVVS